MNVLKSLFGSGRFLVAVATIICAIACELAGVEWSVESVTMILGTAAALILGLSYRQQDKIENTERDSGRQPSDPEAKP